MIAIMISHTCNDCGGSDEDEWRCDPDDGICVFSYHREEVTAMATPPYIPATEDTKHANNNYNNMAN